MTNSSFEMRTPPDAVLAYARSHKGFRGYDFGLGGIRGNRGARGIPAKYRTSVRSNKTAAYVRSVCPHVLGFFRQHEEGGPKITRSAMMPLAGQPGLAKRAPNVDAFAATPPAARKPPRIRRTPAPTAGEEIELTGYEDEH